MGPVRFLVHQPKERSFWCHQVPHSTLEVEINSHHDMCTLQLYELWVFFLRKVPPIENPNPPLLRQLYQVKHRFLSSSMLPE